MSADLQVPITHSRREKGTIVKLRPAARSIKKYPRIYQKRPRYRKLAWYRQLDVGSSLATISSDPHKRNLAYYKEYQAHLGRVFHPLIELLIA